MISIVATEEPARTILQALPCGSWPGAYSNLNVDRRGQTIANLAIVRLDASGETCVYTQPGADIVVDLQGYPADARVQCGASVGARHPPPCAAARVPAGGRVAIDVEPLTSCR